MCSAAISRRRWRSLAPSMSATGTGRRWVVRSWPASRQARRSEARNRSCRTTKAFSHREVRLAAQRRSGLRSFPRQAPTASLRESCAYAEACDWNMALSSSASASKRHSFRETFGYGVVSYALHRASPGQVWPVGKLSSELVQFLGSISLSMPYALQISALNPGHPPPYIFHFSDREAHWERLIRRDSGFIVGIHWQGNPEAERDFGSTGRSLALETLAPLASIPGVRLVSLQKGSGSEQMASCPFAGAFVGCQSEIDACWSMEDAAAIMGVCDLIITADSYPIHLAGGMGLNAWLLLQHVPDWRWGLAWRHPGSQHGSGASYRQQRS